MFAHNHIELFTKKNSGDHAIKLSLADTAMQGQGPGFSNRKRTMRHSLRAADVVVLEGEAGVFDNLPCHDHRTPEKN